ncbi:MAG: hypothetical protein UW69_C0025G0022 [Microgenomates group bacterium GW2011_GWA2_44_7]|nr:MAG: hypothetical protein UW69_C0025G0022 [Microgenomates group bacterium GW2011_GWA2_44_7]KKT78581.1 MAG: hypothetical protein UW73_C0001G0028 [Microgenomates group bacterium GW2011_GWB1_44_8]
MDFFMVELFVERLNRNPQEHVDSYVKQFNELLEQFSKFLPPNIKFISTNLRSQISQKEAIKRLDKKVEELRQTWDQLPKKDREYKLLRAKRNVIIRPEDKGQENKIYLESALAHDAFSSEAWADETIPWAFVKDMLPIGYSYTQGWAIHLRSCVSSTINYWVGTGALRQKGESYIPTILSTNQYQEVKGKIKMEKISLFDQKFVNLQQIPIIKS